MSSPIAYPDVPAEAAAVVDDYLAALAGGLPVARRAKARIIAEISDGLVSTVVARMSEGVAAVDAAQAAVREFGDPRRLAAEFAGQLAPVTAHRTGVALLMTGPVVGLVWVSAYGTTVASWPAKIDAVLSTIAFYPLILAITVPAGLVAVSGAGVLARRLWIPDRWATNAAIIAGCGCLLGDAGLIATTMMGALPAAGSGGLVVAAVGVSVIRAGLAAVASRRIVRLRAASQ